MVSPGCRSFWVAGGKKGMVRSARRGSPFIRLHLQLGSDGVSTLSEDYLGIPSKGGTFIQALWLDSVFEVLEQLA